MPSDRLGTYQPWPVMTAGTKIRATVYQTQVQQNRDFWLTETTAPQEPRKRPKKLLRKQLWPRPFLSFTTYKIKK